MEDKVLIIEDDKTLAELEKTYLEREGYLVEIAYDGPSGMEKVLKGDASLVLLDLMLPGIDGMEICRRIRKEKDMPIIITTAKHGEFNKINGYSLGADDYLEKPFTPKMLLTRTKTHIDRYKKLTGRDKTLIVRGNVTADPETRKVFVNNREVDLKNKEYELLLFFMKNPNVVFDKEVVCDKVWGFDYDGGVETVPVHINRIRDKMGLNSEGENYIQTIRGAGYVFKWKK
ncbi:MAG: response regulator transcription factor [Lachnospiraceae bacterium]|nr:response regulator transcription factor [Lachnospiraceae bacterium]